MFKKPKLSFWQIWNMNFGFFGIQFSFGLQQSNMSAIYKYLGAEESELPLLWLAGPVTGLIVQPIIGAISDGTWSPKWGRRKPFFLIGALVASFALLLMPYSSSLWMAASLLWILDAGNNIAMEPYRAFISDKLNKKQLSLGFLMQSFFTGFGITLANFTPAILVSLGLFALTDKMDNGIPVFTYWAFGIGAFASISTVLYSVLTTKEYPPTEEELAKLQEEKSKGNVLSRTWHEISEAFKEMPLTMKQLIPVKFFSWFGMFAYWMFITSTLGITQYGIAADAINDEATLQSTEYAEAVVLTGQVNGTYNIICFLIAFALVPLARKLGAKGLHSLALAIGGIAILCIPILSHSNILFEIPNPFGDGSIAVTQLYLFSFGLGITWASMMSMPYQLLASSVPKAKTGVYMGIFNMFIVIPMIIQIFTTQFFLYDLLGSNPVNMIRLTGVFLVIAAVFTLFIKTNSTNSTIEESE
ncbi:MFS transporter [Aureitalea marina]|uniref:MFS transporter n=1 Tax=Aureitalea marina TaxID=930804 RepID=A0A2S7KTG2_9FLAO|nr:MFS transporter [Aureitalea marina]PQB05929.1 MFS transporter [Aureitalea marina]